MAEGWERGQSHLLETTRSIAPVVGPIEVIELTCILPYPFSCLNRTVGAG